MKRKWLILSSVLLVVALIFGYIYINKNKFVDKVIENVDKSEENINSGQSEEAIIEEEPEEVIIKKIVVIDPGHSSNGNREKEKQSPDSDILKIKDSGGAQGIKSKVPEYEITMKISNKLKTMLEENGISVIMTKTQHGENPGNVDRAEVGNVNNASLAIRIHCDSAESSQANGASMLVPTATGYAKSISSKSKEYGSIILNTLISNAGMKNRGIIERSDLTGFNWSKVPVVLVETGFLSNPDEDRLLNDDSYQDKIARGLCNGILQALA